jgi:TolB-like protein
VNDRRASTAPIVFGDESRPPGAFALDLQSRELRTAGGWVAMQSQPFEILRLLLERAGEVVERDELRRRLWPDGTFVDYEHSLNAAIRRLRLALGDDAVHPRFVETIPRVGYRFLAETDPATNPFGRQTAQPAAHRSRLAVLPLADVGGGAGFADGLTEELIVEIGRAVGGAAALIARSSSMMFKGMTCRVSEIGEALSVDYVFEGTARRVGDSVRVTASLVETRTETHVWTDAAESRLDQPLAAQAEIAARLAQSLARVFVSQ